MNSKFSTIHPKSFYFSKRYQIVPIIFLSNNSTIIFRKKQENYRYNLVPFREIERFWTYRRELGIHSIYNLAGNVLGFVPAGFFIPVLWEPKRGFLFTVCLTFQMSLLVEILQLVFRVGSFDVDDLILNTLGGMLGYLLLTLIGKWREHEKTKIL